MYAHAYVHTCLAVSCSTMGLIRASAFLYFCSTECKLPPGAHSSTKHNGFSNTPVLNKHVHTCNDLIINLYITIWQATLYMCVHQYTVVLTNEFNDVGMFQWLQYGHFAPHLKVSLAGIINYQISALLFVYLNGHLSALNILNKWKHYNTHCMSVSDIPCQSVCTCTIHSVTVTHNDTG